MTAAAPTRTAWIPASLVLLLLLGAGIWGIQRYVAYEQARDLDHWRQRLDLLADERLDDLNRWLDAQWRIPRELSRNASVRLYLSRVLQSSEPQDEIRLASLGYLRNLLVAQAERAGLFRSATPAVPANLDLRASEGIALFDPEGGLVVATPGFPPVPDEERDLIRELARTHRPGLRDVRKTAGHFTVGFLVPVSPPSGASGEGTVGMTYLLRSLERGLYPRLRASPDSTDETLLVERRGEHVVYLSPQGDGTPPLRRQLDPERTELAAVHAVLHPGTFSIRRDYAGRQVLMTSRPVPGTRWVLLQKSLARTALRESRQHARFLYLTFSLVLLLAAVTMIAAWRHGSSRRARRLASELEEKRRLLEQQHRLLETVTDNIGDYILLLDAQNRVVFANLPLARLLGVDPEDLVGKSLPSALGPGTAGALEKCLKDSRSDSGEERLLTLALGDREGRFLCRATRLPDCTQAERLLVLHDVTALQEAERKRERLFGQLLAALMRAIDRHDPWSVGHSERTARVAGAIAREMELAEADRQALELAARLANIGKILIPKEILTKTGPLSKAEQETLRRHVDHAVDILSQIEFEGPVVEIIAQKQEHMDGSGYPRGLKGEDILLAARILAVANAFVALVSPRAWRDALDIESALERLMEDTPAKYDRHVVAALFHVAENVLRAEDLRGEAPQSD